MERLKDIQLHNQDTSKLCPNGKHQHCLITIQKPVIVMGPATLQRTD
jgi:hypothetical protein